MARRSLVLLVPIALLLAACSDDDPVIGSSGSSTSSTSSTSPTSSDPSSTETTGSGTPGTTGNTTPGAGTAMQGPAGSGEMTYRLVSERSEFCYRISVKGIGEPTEAHVHRTDDEVVLALQPPDADSAVDTCAATDALLIEEMDAAPERFYMDVHGPGGTLKAALG